MWSELPTIMANGRDAGGGAAPVVLRRGGRVMSGDVVVIGGGNAGLVAAIAARHGAGAPAADAAHGATARHRVPRVLLLERAPVVMRGGNTRHTRNARCASEASAGGATASYPADELWSDLSGVGPPGPLARMTVERSADVPAWMTSHGVRWQPPLAGTLHLGRTNRFFLGGGKALVNTYHRAAAALGIEVRYDTCVTDLCFDGHRCTAVVLADGTRIEARAVVCASGGFEANIDWLRKYWGDAADNFLVRGCPENDGQVLASLFAHGAASAGQEKGFHSVAIDARAPKFDGGIATRLDSVPFSIVVNSRGERFYDEGEDLWPKRYAIWGRNVAGQPGQIAYSLWDSKVNERFLPPMFRPSVAPDVRSLAGLLGLDPLVVAATVASYNAAVRPGSFDPSLLDSCRTEGLDPPKSHWALPLDTPPYFGIALRPGITFTYLGVRVDETARVQLADGGSFENVFAAGEIMSGNILSSGYLAGFGVTIGHVWGRIAGEAAAEAAGRD
jgi:tricarballylate dehydrogenase